jgi:iron complex outermembrane recepter protein
MKAQLTLTALLVFIMRCALALPQQPPSLVSVDIQSLPIDKAVSAWAEQTGYQVLIATECVDDGRTSPSVRGTYTPEKALRLLLASTDLAYRFVNSRTVAIQSSTKSDAPAAQRTKAEPKALQVAETAAGGNATSEAIQPGIDTAPSAPSERPKDTAGALPQVIVAAQKRNERLQDVPVPVTVLASDILAQTDQVRIQDYYSTVPGLNVTPRSQSQQVLTIRGVTTGPGNPTVGVVIDGLPFGSSSNLGGGSVVPDIDPADLARVEVLRGPQGTLYGVSSIGGLLDFVTTDPSTEALTGRLQAGLGGVHNGDGTGYNARGSVNVPLSESFAVRASAFSRIDPGYIDNTVSGDDGVNRARVFGGRVSSLWRPLENVSLKLSALYQDSKGDGSSVVVLQPGKPDLSQNYIPGLGAYDRRVQVYNATLTAKLGRADLTSITGYNINEFSDSSDFTAAFGALSQRQFGTRGTGVFFDNKTDKFTEELRLNMPFGQRFEWLVGAYYTHEKSPYTQHIVALNSTSGLRVGDWGVLSFPSTYEEYAGFTDLTVRFTDRFDIQFGGRESHISQGTQETDSGPYATVLLLSPSPKIGPRAEASENAFTYLVTPRFRISPNVMAYARLASGYRAGGTNVAPGDPPQYDPDKTRNYELGLKADSPGGRLSIATAVYYIDWKDLQLALIDPTTLQGYTGNASRAKSQGLEIEAQARPFRRFTISGWVAWSDAVLKERLPASSSVYGASGARLPLSSRFSGYMSVNQGFSLFAAATGFAEAAVSYIGDRKGLFTRSVLGVPQPRQDYPAYAKVDLRTGATYGSWTVNLYANNLTDRRGIIGGGIADINPVSFEYIEPRTIGMSLVRIF